MRRNVWDLVSGFSIILGGVGIIYAAYCYMNPQSKLIGDIGYLIGIIVIFSGFPLLWHYFFGSKENPTKLQCFKDSLMKRCEIGETLCKNETLDKYMVDFWREKTLNIIHRGIGKRTEMFDNITQSFNQIIEDLIKNPNSFMPDDKPPKYRKPQLLAYIYNLKAFIKTELKSINDLLPGFECQDLEEFKGEDEKEYRRVIGGLSQDYLP